MDVVDVLSKKGEERTIKVTLPNTERDLIYKTPMFLWGLHSIRFPWAQRFQPRFA